jgi:hypothetical protein
VGGLRAFKNDSDGPASMLLLFSPGAPPEEYFAKVAETAPRGGQEFAHNGGHQVRAARDPPARGRERVGFTR